MQAFFHGSQVFVWIIHAFTILASVIYDSELRYHLIDNDYQYCFIFFAFIAVELYLLRIAGRNPGIVALAKTDELGEQSAELLDLTHDRGSFIDTEFNINMRTSADINVSIDRSTLLFDSVPLPRRRYCELCQIEQPFRTKHCNDCEACIAKYDHHCFWIGGCVGELNLRKFFFMLLMMNIAFIWMFIIVK